MRFGVNTAKRYPTANGQYVEKRSLTGYELAEDRPGPSAAIATT
jgi:hypothetical protein